MEANTSEAEAIEFERPPSVTQIAIPKEKQDALREIYSKVRHEREQATFAMMMRMDPSALAAIRKEFFAREDQVTLEEFIYIIEKHLNKSDMSAEEQTAFVANMSELFKDIDVNGDGMMEWSEFTTFTVEKANILNKKMKFTTIANYHDSTGKLDMSSQQRRRHDYAQAAPIRTLNQFAILEDNKNAIYIFSSISGKLIKTIITDAVPQAIIHVERHDILVSACADMTMTTHSLDDPNPNRRYRHLSSWATPGIQMALAYVAKKDVLYSGGANGNIYAWDIKERNLLATINAHSDIVMKLLVLKNLNTLVSASLDTTICIWDVYTHTRIMRLEGHKKGVFNIDYNPDYRLLFSCGFDHDICVWSPFVSTMIYRLKGHHATLVGCQCVEGTPEIITADSSGVFKLWDVRKFQCVQTFFAHNATSEYGGSMSLSCFFHVSLPPSDPQQMEDDSRVFAASKTIYSFDQARVVHEATTDFTCVQWVAWNEESSSIFTASEYNVIIWDALTGSKTSTHSNICGNEISAICLDNRKRKLVIGDVTGSIGVYNPLNGALMKSIINNVHSTVVSILYISVADTRRFLAGFANGLIRLYNEESLEDCGLIRSFDTVYSYPELTRLCFTSTDRTAACTGAASTTVKLWDFDTGKCEVDLHVTDPTEHVMMLKYLDPLPLLLTSDSFGNLLIWGSRNCRWPNAKISGFLNAVPASAELEPLSRTIEHEADQPPRRALPADEEQYTQYLVQSSVSRKLQEQFYSLRQSQQIRPAVVMRRISMNNEGSDKPSNTSNNVLSTEEQHAQKMADDMARGACYDQAMSLAMESEKKWGKVLPTEAIGWDSDHYWLYTADEQGFLKKWDLRLLMEEIDATAMMRGSVPSLKSNLLHKVRDQRTALVPVLAEISHSFLIGRRHSISHLGIEFMWCVSAHNDRVVYAAATPHGVLTSATDKLVKMWSHDGRPIGTLLQSVPVGVKSRSWDLTLDIEGILKREEEEMSQVLEGVKETIENPDKPDIEHMEFKGMEPGKDAAPFNRSTLRQRIHKTSKLLGLNFVIEDGGVDSSHSVGGYGSVGTDAASVSDSMTGIDSLSSSVVSKSLKQALMEVKSTTDSFDIMKPILLSALQQRRKETKVAAVAKKYESRRKYKLPAIVRKEPIVSDNISVHSESTKLVHDIDVTLGIAPSGTNSPSSPVHMDHGENNSLTSIRTSPIETRRKKKVTTSRLMEGVIKQSTVQRKCCQYDSFSNLESMLTMDLNAPVSETQLQRFKSKGTYRPIAARIPSLMNLFDPNSPPLTRVNSMSSRPDSYPAAKMNSGNNSPMRIITSPTEAELLDAADT